MNNNFINRVKKAKERIGNLNKGIDKNGLGTLIAKQSLIK